MSNSINLGFEKPFWVNESGNLNDGVDRADFSEQLTMNRRDNLPVLDSSEEEARADNVSKRSAKLLES